MNYLMVLKELGILLICEALAMIPSLGVAIWYKGNDVTAFLYTIGILLIIGLCSLFIKPKNKTIYARDGFAIAAIGWILASFFGSLPFYFSGAIPSLVDCFFETVSGLTTTGSSILTNVEALPLGLTFWRSFTHWIGGMGILVLTMAILPNIGAGNMQIMKAESPGPNPGKLVPRLKKTAIILYEIYIVITIIEIILLKISGLPLYDCCIYTFGSVGTGGFSNKSMSVGYYNNLAAEIIITIFCFSCGINFSLYYLAIKGNIKDFLKDEEFRLYAVIVLVATILITFNLNVNIFHSFGKSLRQAAFQVVTIITTTGYASTDFNQWPTFSKTILLILMFIGGCAGSTAGSVKNIRILLLFKSVKREVHKIIHPKSVSTVKYGGKTVNEGTLSAISSFFVIYIFIYFVALILVSLDGKDMITNISAVATTLGNVGPGLGEVGPMGNFSSFSDFSKLVMSFCMLAGRLEIYPLLLLFSRQFWKK